MYSFNYENNGSTTYLVYQVQPNDEMDTMSLGMLTNNKILGLAPAIFTQIDSAKFIKYNVSAKISVKQFFEGQVNKKRLIGVFTGIANAILAAEDYMIDLNSIILDLDYIFSDVSSCETVLICLPINRQEENNSLLSFFKTIMFSTQFDQTENCDYVAKIINYLNSASAFSVLDFIKILDGISSNTTISKDTSQGVSSSHNQINKPISTIQQQEVEQLQTVVPQISANQPFTRQQAQQRDDVIFQSSTVKRAAVKAMPPKTYTPPIEPEISDDERISFMYLMQHYNKENAEKYKAQKAAKKAKKGNNTKTPSKANKQTQISFNVPSTPANAGFAVPGVLTQDAVFAIPGQQISVTPVVNQTQVNKPIITQTQNSRPVQQQVNQNDFYQPPVDPQSKDMNFGETTVLGGENSGETTVLSYVNTVSSHKEKKAFIIRVSNNERIEINKPVFRIGKEKSYVDYFIGDNSYISRGHANIIQRDSRYYIIDNNSRNHTYVNGNLITSSTEVEIQSGDTFKLANEAFEFKLF